MTQAAPFGPSALPSVRVPPASRPLLVGLGLGALTEALFHGAPLGANYTLFVLALVALVAVSHPRRLAVLARPRVAFASTLAIASASALSLRASTWSAVFAVPVSATLVALLPVLVNDDRSLARATLRAIAAPARIPAASHDIVRESAPMFGPAGLRVVGRALVGLLIGAPVAAGFALLLAFDPNFTKAIDGLVDRAWGTTSVVVWGVLSGTALLFGHRALARRDHEPSPERQELPYRQATDAAAPVETSAPGVVSPLTWSLIVGQTAGVFLLYAGVNARAWFAGHGAISAPGETYATYLHAGFIQLLMAATLSVGMVLVGHFLLRPYGSTIRVGPVPGGKRLAAIEIALLLGTALALVSCAQRLVVYVEAYGATYERLGVGVVCLFVGFVVALTTWKSARRDFARYASVLLGGAAVLGTACALFDADGTIARFNVERGARGEYVDEEYLANLSCDARPVLARPELTPERRALLDEAWTTPRMGRDVRGFRGALACGQ